MGVNRKFDFRQVWGFCWDFRNFISGGNWLFRCDCVFSGGTLYPSANYGNQNLKLLVLLSYSGGLKVRSHLINWFLSRITYVKPWTIWKNYQNLSTQNLKSHSNLKSAALDDFTFAKLQCFSNIASKVQPYLKMYQTDNQMIPSMYFDLNA